LEKFRKGHLPGTSMMKTTLEPPRSVLTGAKRSRDPLRVPVLCARPGGPAERLARSVGTLHPAVVFALVMLGGLVAIAILSIGLGFLVTRVVEPAWGIGAADERVNTWLALHRTASRTHASLLGSIIAGGVVLPIIAGSLAIVFAILRRWRIAAFFAFGLAVESATYRATTLAVHSHRPHVARLEHLPVNASYPSGHTAASIAVYGGIVLLLTSRIANTAFRSFAWLLGFSIVAFVALARMYRGMHHPLDVAGGIFVGVAALTVIVFACRTAGAAADLRDDGHPKFRGRS
jgi:membrane-associated phospholipid phosphatase